MQSRVSFAGPQMAANVTVYLKDPSFGEYRNGLPVELAFGPGTTLDTDDLSEETKAKVARLVTDGFAVEIPKAAEKGELE